jgi:hypothetical protein
MAGWTGLEPATSDVTGRRSNRLNYHPNLATALTELCDLQKPSVMHYYYS